MRSNIGYGFLLSYLLKLKGITLKPGSKLHLHTYLFKTSMKKSKTTVSISETSLSSSAPFNVVMEKAKVKKRKAVRKMDLQPAVPVPFGEESDSGSNEPVVKNTKTAELALSTVEPAIIETSFSPVGVVRPYATEIAEKLIEVVDQPTDRANEEQAQRPMEEIEVLTVLPAERLATTPAQVDFRNPTLGIMDVVQAVNEEAVEVVNTLAPVVDDTDWALAAQFDCMLEEPITMKRTS